MYNFSRQFLYRHLYTYSDFLLPAPAILPESLPGYKRMSNLPTGQDESAQEETSLGAIFNQRKMGDIHSYSISLASGFSQGIIIGKALQLPTEITLSLLSSPYWYPPLLLLV